MLGLFRRPAKAAGEGNAPPQTYAQWSDAFDLLAKGNDDQACLARLQQGELSWTGGVAPLFVQRLAAEVQRRLDQCAARLERDLRQGGGETEVVQAMLGARKQLGFIHRLCQLPCMPENTRAQLSAEVRRFAERSQESLAETAKADRSGQLALWVRRNPLDTYATDGHVAGQPPTTSQTALGASGGNGARRRQIMQ